MITDEEIAKSFPAARRLCRAGAREIYFATYFLPRKKRRAVDAIGAFCAMIVEAIALPEKTLVGAGAMREHPVIRSAMSLQQLPAENAGDACDGDTLDARLQMLRERLDEIYDNRVELPAIESRSDQQHALVAISWVASEFEIDRQLFMDFALARREGGPVGATIGVMISSVLGVTHSEGRRHAMALGSAIELAGQPELPPREVDRAKQFMETGANGICWLADDGSRLAVATATVASAARLKLLQDDRPPRLSMIQKMRLLPATIKLARRADGQLLPRLF